MSLQIALRGVREGAPFDDLFDEHTDVGGILMDVCDQLAATGDAVFEVEWCGEGWPVDIRTDLAVVLEQLPSVFAGLHGSNFVLSFYEQGIERDLEFERAGSSWAVSCVSHVRWQPSADTVHVDGETVQDLFVELRDTFDSVVKRRARRIWENQMYQKWLASCR